MGDVNTEGGTGTPAGAAPGASASGDLGTGASKGGPDFLSRVRSDPDFAAEQVTNHQSRADREAAAREKAEARVKSLEQWLGPLTGLEGKLDGASMTGALNDMGMLMQDPRFERLVTRDATGRIQGLRRGEGSPLDDDDEDFRSPEAIRIEQLEQQLQQVNQRLGQTETSDGMRALTEHLEDFQREWNLPEEAFERVRSGLISQVQTWQAQGAVGQQALTNLTDRSKGANTVRSLAMGLVSKDDLRKGLDNESLRRKQRVSGLATDGPPPAPGDEGTLDPAAFKGNAVEALLAARANPEKNTSL